MYDEREGKQYTLADVARACSCTTENIRALLKRGRVPEDATPIVDPVTGTRWWPPDRFQRFVAWNAARRERMSRPEDSEGSE